MRFEKHKVLQNCRAASLWGGLQSCCWATKGVRGCLPGEKKEGRSVLYIIAPLSHSLHLVSWIGVRRQDWVRTGRRRSWAWWAKRVCLGNRGGGARPESSWAPRAASFGWAAHQALIQSWSRTRRRRRTPRCLYGLCTSCCQKSSLSGAECSPWPSPVHELRYPQTER